MTLDFSYIFRDWQNVIQCFMTTLDQCDNKGPLNVVNQYFQDVVSISPCATSIPGFGGANGLRMSIGIVLMVIMITILTYFM